MRPLLTALALVCLPLAWTADTPPPTTVTALIKGHLFELELAATPATRERGLMERLEMPPDRGMLFAFPDEAPRRFWMKNTRVDLDIVYLDRSGAVVSVATMRAEPPQGQREPDDQYEDRLPFYPSAGPAAFAIEFCSGTLGLLGLVPGENLGLDVPRLRALAR